ncbi:MAG: VCBS repeat-containing protein [Alphaproteobacteria bacterium]|nr:VCBS repeat-containing protein [Alphaproteobacteria bacterium]MCB9796675.1 VCBS repeat-containing protein [Alphaproteobacteria bacterium]
MPVLRSSLLPLALLLGCTEYNVNEKDDDPIVIDDDTGSECPPSIPDCQETDDSDPVDSDSGEVELRCPEFYAPGGTLEIAEECAVEPQTGTFTPVTEWSWSTFSTYSTFDQVMMTPIVASITDDDGDGDIDEDDTPDILFATYTGTNWTGAAVLRALHGDGSGEILGVNANLEGSAGLAAGDIDGDGIVEIIGINLSKQVVAFEHDGSTKWTSAAFSATQFAYAPYPAISDMDGDGSPEIIVGSVILNSDGSTRAQVSGSKGSAGTYSVLSFAVDLDADGTQELITGNAVYDPDGNELWRANVPDGYPAVADFDGDGEGEVVGTANGEVWLLDTDGALLWRQRLPNSSSTVGPPTIADFDGDDEPEIGVAGISLYAVFETDGTLLWWQPSQDSSSGVTGSAVFDFEGDGAAEAVYPDETRTWVFAGGDGAIKLESTEHSSWTVTEYAPIVDVDGDGQAEIVVPNCTHPSYTNLARAGITVVGDADGSWRAGPRIWNQHAFHITNVDEDGGIPRNADLNWLEYNSFRSGNLLAIDEGGLFPDLVPQIAEVCEERCAEGVIEVWVQVGNRGGEAIEPGAEVQLSAVTPNGTQFLAAQVLSVSVDAGELLETLHLEISGVQGLDIRDLELVADPSDDLNECDEDNNVVRWGQGVCMF